MLLEIYCGTCPTVFTLEVHRLNWRVVLNIWLQKKLAFMLIIIILKNIYMFIYLSVADLSCGMQTLSCACHS